MAIRSQSRAPKGAGGRRAPAARAPAASQGLKQRVMAGVRNLNATQRPAAVASQAPARAQAQRQTANRASPAARAPAQAAAGIAQAVGLGRRPQPVQTAQAAPVQAQAVAAPQAADPFAINNARMGMNQNTNSNQ